jgi:hypothetical protein
MNVVLRRLYDIIVLIFVILDPENLYFDILHHVLTKQPSSPPEAEGHNGGWQWRLYFVIITIDKFIM